MSYEQIKDLQPALFKRYCGVKPETFQKMVEVISDHLARTRIKTGRLAGQKETPPVRPRT